MSASLDYSFNGSIYPIRAAPYYQYLAGLLDLLTGRSLGFFALEHLTAIVSVLAGVAAAYRALVWIAPGRRWSAAALALLYVMCPGVAGLFYAQDLYMSGMALPWVPLAFAALVRSFDDDSLGPQAVLAMSLAALWWAHSPIALWATAFTAVGEIVRLIVLRPSRPGFARAAVATCIFAALAAYPFVSVFLLRTPGEAIVPYIMDRQALLEIVRKSFPSSSLPADRSQCSHPHLHAAWLRAMARPARVRRFVVLPPAPLGCRRVARIRRADGSPAVSHPLV